MQNNYYFCENIWSPALADIPPGRRATALTDCLEVMKKYDFDTVIDRRGSGASKYEELRAMFGRDDLIPLWIADMDFAVCPQISESLRERMSHPIYGYSAPCDGYWQSILNWLDHRHGMKASRDEVTYIPGVVKGIGFAVNFFTRPGDRIVIQPPVYHPFKMVIEGNDRVVVNNPLIRRGDSYEMDLAGLRDIIEREHPRMMVLCNPHNPIGIQWDEATLREVAAMCRANGVIVVSDEIHGDLMLHGRRHIPYISVSDDAAATGIMLGAPSKTFNIPGMVSSWCIIKNPELREPFYHWLNTNEFNSPTFTATLATETAYENGEEWLDEALEYIEANIDAVTEYLSANLPEVKAIRPQTSFLVWLDCTALHLTQEQLVNLFVKDAHLALNDGAMFGAEGRGYMRLNVATPRATLMDAMEHLRRAIHKPGK